MSCSTELNDLMKVINRKFRDQRRLFENQRDQFTTQLENARKNIKERDGEIASLRRQLLEAKARQLELEKLVVDQNQLVRRMGSKLEESFGNRSSESPEKSVTRPTAVQKSSYVDKCVATEEWNTLLEKELTERIKTYAAYLQGRETGESSGFRNRWNSLNSLDTTNHSHASSRRRKGENSGHTESRIANESKSADISSISARVNGRDGQPDRADSVVESFAVERPFSLAVRSSTPATSVWRASTGMEERHVSDDGKMISGKYDGSNLTDDTLQDFHSNMDVSAVEDELMRKFCELESEAQALFGTDAFGDAEKGETSKNSSALADS